MYLFIINPTAGHGRAKRIFSKIATSELYQDIDSIHYYTQYGGHAEQIIRHFPAETYNKLKAIIVIGGDGTLHEVINGLENENRLIRLAFIPGGSGNDFARGVQIKEKPLDLFRRIIMEEDWQIPYWTGYYCINNSKERRFVNSIGFGFDAEVARHANRTSLKKWFNLLHIGKLSYVFAIIRVLFRFKPFTAKLVIDGERRTINNCLMITIANHPFYGGGMKIIPDASIKAATFPVLMIHSISKLKLLALFLTVFWGGHIKFKQVELCEAMTIDITVSKTAYFQVDGETHSFRTCTVKKESLPVYVTGSAR